MNKVSKSLIKKSLLQTRLGVFIAPLVTSVFFSASAMADLVLSNNPLLMGTTGDPNVLFIIDGSASMQNVPEETPYNYPGQSGGHDFSCSTSDSDFVLPTATNIYYEFRPHLWFAAFNMAVVIQRTVTGSGAGALVTTQEYVLGKGGGTTTVDHYDGGIASTKTYNVGCFDNDLSYQAFLHAMGGSVANPDYTEGGFAATGGFAQHTAYAGHYLNWYYANAGLSATARTTNYKEADKEISPDVVGYNGTFKYSLNRGGIKKDAVLSRMQYVNERLQELLGDTLTDSAQLAVATFLSEDNDPTDSSASNLEIVFPFTSRDTESPSSRMQAVGNTLPRANTSLARGVMQGARYFLEGSPDSALELSSSDAAARHGSSTINKFTLFSEEPVYASDVTIANGFGPAQEAYRYFADVVKPTSGQAQSCNKNHLFILTDGLSRKTVDGYTVDTTDPFSPDKTSDILGVWDDGVYDYDVTNPTQLNDLVGVTSALYEMDLRPDIDTFHNNISTYIVGFQIDNPDDEDLLRRAAAKGGGLFFPEDEAFDTNRGEMQRKLQAIVADIRAQGNSQNGTLSRVAFSTDSLTNDTLLLLPTFKSDRWSGDMVAWDLQVNGAIDEVAGQLWSAADLLDARTPSTRVIYTQSETTSNKGVVSELGVTFDWDNLTDEQKSDLGFFATLASDYASLTDSDKEAALQAEGEQVLAFLRGDRTRELDKANGVYRKRDSSLGDMIHSNPVTVYEPNLNLPDYRDDNRFGGNGNGGDYSDFKAQHASRTPVVYVGANDGMLHGFDASTGQEVMAYIPRVLYSTDANKGLHYLADQAYSHRYYVDGSPSAADVYTDGDWRTLLVGVLGAGGRGVYALDVTDPASFSNTSSAAANTVLWEFDHTDDPDLGFVFGQPTITLLPNGVWGVVIGNGYNSDNQNAYLFVINAEGPGTDGAWDIGSDYWKIPVEGTQNTPVDSIVGDNGLSDPRLVDTDGDHVADRAYAGDLEGNLWAFDLSSTTASQWANRYGRNPLFTGTATVNGTTYPQAITTKPLVISHPSPTESYSELVVVFGTGKLLEGRDTDDVTDYEDVPQAFYAVEDVAEYTGSSRSTAGSGLEATDLAQRAITEEAFSDGAIARRLTGQAMDWSSQPGWALPLTVANPLRTPDWVNSDDWAAERVVFDPQLFSNDLLLFSTSIPTSLPCELGGDSWEMFLDIKTGLELTERVDRNNDGVIDNADATFAGRFWESGVATGSSLLEGSNFEYKSSSGAAGEAESTLLKEADSSSGGRLSWEEVFR